MVPIADKKKPENPPPEDDEPGSETQRTATLLPGMVKGTSCPRNSPLASIEVLVSIWLNKPSTQRCRDVVAFRRWTGR